MTQFMSANNQADDLTRNNTLHELAVPKRWFRGHRSSMIHLKNGHRTSTEPEEVAELKQSTFCGHTHTSLEHKVPDITQFNSWTVLVRATQ